MENTSIQEEIQKCCRLGDIQVLRNLFKDNLEVVNQTDKQLG